MKKYFRYVPVLTIILISLVYYWRLFLGFVPFPGDLLIGAYLPWLEYKWGNVVGVAIKNTLISDIFSQFFLWKNEIARNYLHWQWPLWNPYSYSGYPLLANFNSGALNPMNLLFVIFGMINGWSIFIVLQTVGSALSMYLFLRVIKKRVSSSIVGSVVYAFGGFSILWSQFVNVGCALIWIPLILVSIELSQQKNDSRWLLPIGPLLFLIVTAGHMQAVVYGAVLTLTYFVFRNGARNKSFNLALVKSVLIALGMSAIQLLPTIELMNLSIRFADQFTSGINFGLLPARNIITMIAPDFFGNPSTGNFWGFFDYHETMTYAGVIGVVGLVFGVMYFKKLKQEKFFLVVAIVSLLFQFDTPLGRAIYLYKVPFLSTSVAGRIDMVYLLCVSVLVAEMLEQMATMNWKNKIKPFLPIALILVCAGGISFFLMHQSGDKHMIVALRNLVVPTVLLTTLLTIFLAGNKVPFWRYLVLLLVVADLFRFGWKYIPFVPKSYIYPETEAISFVKKDKSIFRVEKELGEILPQNTWTAYQMMSPSGYDPMAIETYVKAFSHDLNMVDHPEVTRFNEINTYDAKALGKYNVKYLFAIKRDKLGKVGGDNLNYAIKINPKEWKKVFETKDVAVLENRQYKERARVIYENGEEASGSASIESYTNNKIIVNFKNTDGDALLLVDTYYPGWVAKINNVPTKIDSSNIPFRTVSIKGLTDGQIVFEYKPRSFYWGLWISLASLIIWLMWFLASRKQARPRIN